ncbi:hypothetical protein GGR52DRAFT_178475 [Hypoxylon sp. FL1284]|nr:hypothetical protein GGR52DRAFT_178475 [Hypoxylon sp. FL1284]
MRGSSYLCQPIWLVVFLQCVPASSVDWTSITNSRGDRLPDFSFCGYHASDKALPSNSGSSSVTLQPSSGDQTSKIQEALDKTAASGGGIVELGAGTFHISSGLNITSGTTLRGSGISSTELSVDKLSVNVPVISLGNGTNHQARPLKTTSITNTYVGIGARTVTVESTEGLRQGQEVFVSREATADWIRYNGMADLVRDGKKQTWIGVGTVMQQLREIKSIKGKDVTFTVPLTDALDKKYMSPYIATFTSPATSQEIGLEDLSITHKPTCSGKKLDSTDPCASSAIAVLPWTVDSWVRLVNVTGFNNFINVQTNSSRITIENVSLFRDAESDGSSGWPSDIFIEGSQVLVQDSGQYGLSTARAFAVVTGSRTPGPNAVLRHVTQSSEQQLYPHQRWAHGFLVEDTDASVCFINRGTAGSGHGWTINAGVAWNVRGDVQIQSPPLGINWGFGSTGKIVSPSAAPSNGSLIDTGSTVTPKSLFEAQLSARSGGG